MSVNEPFIDAASVDHVWGNARVLMPAGTTTSACQLGGDHLGPHLAGWARSTVAIGASVAPGPGWCAIRAPSDRTPLRDRSVDLVVIEDLGRTGASPDRVLTEARRICRTTGVIVVGFRSRPAGLQSLIAAHRAGGDAFTALPSSRRPAFLVLARDREAAWYFVRRIAFAYRRPGEAGVRMRLQQCGSRAALMAPASLALHSAPARITVLPSAHARRSLLDGLKSYVRESWEDLSLPGPPPPRLSALVIGHRRPATGMATVLLFRPGDRAPAIVAKLPRYGGTAAPLAREHAALQRARNAIGDEEIRAALPRPLGIVEVDGVETLLQTGVGGRHLVAQMATRRIRPSTILRQFELPLSWCVAMQLSSRRTVTVDEALIAAKIESPMDAAVEALEGDEHVQGLLQGTLSQARRLMGTTLPLVVSHGDYWAGNVFVGREGVDGVVDWERAEADDLPLWDPVKVIGSVVYHLDRYRSVPRRGAGSLPMWGDLGPWRGLADPHFAVGFRAAFAQPGWLADLARDALSSAFVKAGIPLAWLPVAVSMYLVRQVVQSGDSPRSIAGWGSVLKALAAAPDTWADAFADHGITASVYRSAPLYDGPSSTRKERV